MASAIITLEELSKHSTPQDAWIAIHGKGKNSLVLILFHSAPTLSSSRANLAVQSMMCPISSRITLEAEKY